MPDWLLRSLFWSTLTLLLIWLIWQIYSLLTPYLAQRSPRSPTSASRPSAAPDQVLTAADWWQRSLQYQQQGDYREACRALYMAMLMQLGDRGLLTPQDSVTDGEYLQLVQQLPKPHIYQLLISTHEQLLFSDAAISTELYERCRAAYQEIATP